LIELVPISEGDFENINEIEKHLLKQTEIINVSNV
jgi:hypothetical protein